MMEEIDTVQWQPIIRGLQQCVEKCDVITRYNIAWCDIQHNGNVLDCTYVQVCKRDIWGNDFCEKVRGLLRKDDEAFRLFKAKTFVYGELYLVKSHGGNPYRVNLRH